MNLTEHDIKRIVRETIAEERRNTAEETDETVLKTIAAILAGFGIDEDEKKDIKEDFRYLRKFRNGSEKITGMTLTAAVTVVVGGLLSALYLGVKTMLGK